MMRMSSASIGRMNFGSCTPFRSGLRNGPSRWMPSRPGTPAARASSHGGDRLRHLLARVGDEGRQEAGRAEAAMRGADRADAVDAALVVEEHAAAAVHLHVDEARREQPLDRAMLDPRAELLDALESCDPPVLDHDSSPFEHARAVEDRGPGDGVDAHARASFAAGLPSTARRAIRIAPSSASPFGVDRRARI